MRVAIVGIAAACIALSSLQASAADLPVAREPIVAPAPAAYNWTGFYAGVYGGYGFGTQKSGGFLGSSLSPNGGVAGGTIGFNYQPYNGTMVIGAEVDAGWADIKGSETIIAAGAVAAGTSTTEMLTTVRGRIGAAFDRLLIFGTGGFAWGRNQLAISAALPALGVAAAVSDTQSRYGWVAGGGAEYAFTNNLSAKVEYLFYEFGEANYFAFVAPMRSNELSVSTVKVGVNFHF